jgi:membrane-associated protease RseP (regulator of RpoE activity)
MTLARMKARHCFGVGLLGMAMASGASAQDPAAAAAAAPAPVVVPFQPIAPVRALGLQTKAAEAEKAAAETYHRAVVALVGGGPATGLTLEPADDAVRAQLQLPEGQGLVVTSVAPDSAADKAGLQKNDILLTLGGQPLANSADFDKKLHEAEEAHAKEPAKGTVWAIKLLRGGKEKSVESLPMNTIRYRLTRVAEAKVPEYYIGVPIGAVDEVLRSHLDLPEGRGLVLGEPMADSPATKAGLKKGDILLEVGGQRLEKLDDLVEKIQATKGDPVAIKLLRAGKGLTVEVTPEKRKEAVNALVRDYKPGASRDFLIYGPGVVVGPDGKPTVHVQSYQPNLPNATRVGQGLRLTVPHQYLYRPATPEPSVDKRLDEIAEQIKELRKILEDLNAKKP